VGGNKLHPPPLGLDATDQTSDGLATREAICLRPFVEAGDFVPWQPQPDDRVLPGGWPPTLLLPGCPCHDFTLYINSWLKQGQLQMNRRSLSYEQIARMDKDELVQLALEDLLDAETRSRIAHLGRFLERLG
jgi:hypothetical protein